MRHVFIVNPAAGKTRKAVSLVPAIEAYFKEHGGEYTIRETIAPDDATRIAREECEKGDAIRLYACGGDGTVTEVAAGIPENSAVQLAIIPCGSANDYVRSFGSDADFFDLPSLIEGTVCPVDGIRCGKYLSLNICAMGMDALVAWKMVRYKHWPLVSGPTAYKLAVLDVLCHRIGCKLRVVMDTPDGEVVREGDFLFSLAASGQYYGGGYHASPLSQPNDGLLDFILVRKVGKLKVLGLLKKYRAGAHLDLDICEHLRGTCMRVYCDKPTPVTADGECFADTEIAFELVKDAFNFVIPKHLAKEPATV